MPVTKEMKKLGRKPQVQLAEIINAATVLQQQQKNISGWSLRQEIGYGSPKNLIATWENHNKTQGNINYDIS